MGRWKFHIFLLGFCWLSFHLAGEELRIFQLNHLAPEEGVRILRQLYGDKLSLTAVPSRSMLIVRGEEAEFRAVEAMLRDLDRSPASFMITLSRPLSQNDRDRSFGVRAQYEGAPESSYQGKLKSSLEAGERRYSRKSSNQQSLRVVAGSAGYFFLGEQRIFSPSPLSQPVTQNIGKTLMVTPYEVGENQVRLDLKVDYSTPGQDNAVQSSALKTQVIVQLGKPQSIGGIIQSDSGYNNSIGGLKPIEYTENNRRGESGEDFVLTVTRAE